jgi:hypothetical protein
METGGEALPSPEQARPSATSPPPTPWPTYLVVTITAQFVVLPVTIRGALAEREWLMPQGAWLAAMVGAEAVFVTFFLIAARKWRAKTGVAPRLDVPPTRATLPVLIGSSLLIVNSGYVFMYTGEPLWLFATSAVGATLSIGFHLWFVHLHRKAS